METVCLCDHISLVIVFFFIMFIVFYFCVSSKAKGQSKKGQSPLQREVLFPEGNIFPDVPQRLLS